MKQLWLNPYKKTSTYKPIITVICLWLADELIEDFLLIPLLNYLPDSNFLVQNVLYKLLSLGIILLINKITVTQHVYIHYKFKKFSIKKALIFLLIAYFIIIPLFSHSNRIFESVIIGIIAAVPEEYFYRGIILGNLLREQKTTSCKNRQVIVCLLLSSFLFSLAHIDNIRFQSGSETLFQVIQVFGYGLIFGASYIRSGSLIFPMIIHFFIDFGTTCKRHP